jgi:single-strand DNA-binding protein
MNKVNLIGRLTSDPELRYNSSDIAYTRFVLAVNRPFTNSDGEREADFISCVAWRKTAELICEHFKKGSEIGLSGRIQTGNYERADGTKAYTTDIIIEEITFVGSKKENKPEPEYAERVEETNPFESNRSVKRDEIILSDDDLPF